jgi:hypothetical protein
MACDRQITVPLPASLRDFVQAEAARDDRSLASVIRKFIAAEAARRKGQAKPAGA